MKTVALAFMGLFAAAASSAQAAETLSCYGFKEVETEAANGGIIYETLLDAPEKATIEIGDDGALKSVVLDTQDAMEKITFVDYMPVTGTSRFAKWFQFEAHDMAALDGSSFSIDIKLWGAYVGVSPQITDQYDLYEALKDRANAMGLPMPKRTLVLFDGDRSMLREYFCD